MLERFTSINCSFTINGNEYNGIIKKLTDENGGRNIHDCGIIEVTSDFTFSNQDNHQPKNVVAFSTNGCFYSRNENNATIVFDFKDNLKINIENYSLKSICSGGSYGCHLRNWAIDVSDDGNEWTTIHNVVNCPDMNEPCTIKTFAVYANDLLTRYCRLRVTGENWPQNESNEIHYNIGIFQIEFYGYLYKK